MASWKDVLTHLAADAENRMDELRYRMSYALGGVGPIKILTYRGYGAPDRLYLRGRVVVDKKIPAAEQNDNLWENLVNMYKRLESDEVPNARLIARFQGQEKEVLADEEGHFEAWIEPVRPLPQDRLFHSVEFELIDPLPDPPNDQPVKASGEVLVPPSSARYVVVSDIDDTVLRSDATHLIKMARNVFLGNAHTRLPFPGVAGLYRAFSAGKSGGEQNPLFYVSSSPWNLYDLLSQFFLLQEIPVGPVFLRDWGLTREELLPVDHREYKISTIRKMLNFYKTLPFVLVGDSGQEDPEIYAELVREFPKRIQAVYIRNVVHDLKRPEMVKELAKGVVEAGSSLVLADDSVAIARHAIEHGLIAPESLPSITEEKNKDQAPPSPVEKLIGEEVKVAGPTVQVEGRTDTETKQAVKEGAVEEAVKSAADKHKQKPPTVVVESKEAAKKEPKEK